MTYEDVVLDEALELGLFLHPHTAAFILLRLEEMKARPS